MKFAENFKLLLKLKSKSQSDAAEFFDVSDNTVSNWVNGKTYPSIDMMEKIAGWLGVSARA